MENSDDCQWYLLKCGDEIAVQYYGEDPDTNFPRDLSGTRQLFTISFDFRQSTNGNSEQIEGCYGISGNRPGDGTISMETGPLHNPFEIWNNPYVSAGNNPYGSAGTLKCADCRRRRKAVCLLLFMLILVRVYSTASSMHPLCDRSTKSCSLLQRTSSDELFFEYPLFE